MGRIPLFNNASNNSIGLRFSIKLAIEIAYKNAHSERFYIRYLTVDVCYLFHNRRVN